jgi:NADPH:quinone reductase-like Zn-dependent oxidoreductase
VLVLINILQPSHVSTSEVRLGLLPTMNATSTLLLSVNAMLFGKKNWDPVGKVSIPCLSRSSRTYCSTPSQHCYITGGSSGLGLCLAVLLAQSGAHVTIVARDQDRLDRALGRLQVRVHNIPM